MGEYKLEKDTFIIENYDKKAPFCSFLPGLTGEKGIPVWSFYVNRGQCITSFGVSNKENPIMEFAPANVAYENTAVKGFRTFVRKNGKYFEPFFANPSDNVERKMLIKKNSLTIVETDNDNLFRTEVTYFILPNEPFGAIVRRATFENLGDEAEFEILDGMPRIIPFGVSGSDFSRMANLMRSYNTVGNLENKIPMFFNEIKGDDDAEVKRNVGGYYYMSFGESGLVCPIYDPFAIFGEETSLVYPSVFAKKGLSEVESVKQHGTNKICACFVPVKATLKKGEKKTVTALCGYAHSPEFINAKAKYAANDEYIDEKLKSADELADIFTNDVDANTSNKLLDMYFRQCYLDNFLRGGYPFIFKGENDNKVVHLFSRKHGDPERDYNYFAIAAEYFSQGDGNFRDVLQNRRNDVLFHPEVSDFNILNFFSLIQFEGYNPLVVKGTTFTIKEGEEENVKKIIDESVNSNANDIFEIVSKKFTAGSLINGIYKCNAELKVSDEQFLGALLEKCDQNFEASTDKFGNWSDHWDYLLDLIESYKKVYPDKMSELLYDNREYKYFDSDLFVMPRSKKYFYNGKEPRQFDSFIIDSKKYERDYLLNDTNWLKTKDGKVYKTNLIEKLLSLCVNKIALLDPCQMGIEMEANRAGWCDATSGLPSMFGSGMSETFELKNLCEFTISSIEANLDKSIVVPIELLQFMLETEKAIDEKSKGFELWDALCNAKEKFREEVRYEISGETAKLDNSKVISVLKKYLNIINGGIEDAIAFGNGFCPTYIKYEPTEFDIVADNPGGYDHVVVHAFKPVAVAKFLEGPAKQMKYCGDPEKAEEIISKVKDSNVFDKKLKMYKTSESLANEGLEFGRIAAFTPGWQENESIFLHMEYKFLLAIFQAGAYEQFYSEMKNVFIPFCKPEIYGRSILENCSFLASSANPDENLHGRGFVSRLSGSTTEVISIWTAMFLGNAPFVFEKGKLGLNLKPMLEAELFNENGEVSFNFLTDNKVIVHNDAKVNTFELSPKYVVINGIKYDGDIVWGEPAEKVRSGKNNTIELYY